MFPSAMGQEGVNDLASQLQASLLARIKQNLDEFLSKPHSLNRINAEALRSGLVSQRDFTGQRARFLQQVQAIDSVVACAFGSKGGDFIGAGWRSEGVFDSAIADKAADNDYRVFVLDEMGEPAELVSLIHDYDPRTRSWYQAALNSRYPTWSPIYVWASEANIGISAVMAVYDRSGALMGVQQAALSLEHIGRFLRSLKIGKSGQAFIVERSGMLVASSFEPPTRPDPGSQKATVIRFQATESASPLIRSAARHLTERFGKLDSIVSDETMRVSREGGNYFLNVAPFSDGRGLEWIITTIVSESDFMAHVNANARVTLLMSISALILAVSLGALVARWVTQPIVKLNVAAQEMSRGKWQKVVVIDRFEELGELAASFNRMGDQLRESFETLENRVRERTRELAAANERLNSDIAERKRAEEALRASEAKYRNLFENMAEEVHFWQLVRDDAGRIKTWRLVDANLPTLKTWGRRSVDEIRGKTTDEIFGPGAAEHYLPIVQQIMTEGVPHSFEDYFPNLDKYFRFTSVPLGEYFITTGADITGIKKAEEAFRTSEEQARNLIKYAPTAIFEVDFNATRFLSVNEATCDLSGYTREELLAMSPLSLTDEPSTNLFRDWARRKLSEEKVEDTAEFKVKTKDGRKLTMAMRVSAFTYREGKPVTVLVIGHDITERKRVEEALKKAHDELEIRVRERTSELSEAVEKLRVENIQRKEMEDTLRESENQVRFFASQCLTAQETERKRIAGELHDSIAASLGAIRLRIERAAQDTKQGPCSPESLQEIASAVAMINNEVRRIMADLRPSILDDLGIIPALTWFCREYQKTYSHISVENQIGVSEHEVPDSLKTPIFRICQEAMNNIAKHSQASHINLSLQKEGERVVLTVQDHGQGFDLQRSKKGLGLSTMVERAELSGGRFELETAKGKGTIIRATWTV